MNLVKVLAYKSTSEEIQILKSIVPGIDPDCSITSLCRNSNLQKTRMHSSRMRTARALTLSVGGGGLVHPRRNFGEKIEKKRGKKFGDPPKNWRHPPEKLETTPSPKNWRHPPKKLEPAPRPRKIGDTPPKNWKPPPKNWRHHPPQTVLSLKH